MKPNWTKNPNSIKWKWKPIQNPNITHLNSVEIWKIREYPDEEKRNQIGKKKKAEFIRNSHYSLSKLDKRAWPWWQARSSPSKLSRKRVKYLELMDGHFVGIQTDRGKKVTGDDSPRSVDGDLWSKLKLWFGFLRVMAIVDSNCEEILEREMRNWRFYSGRPLSFFLPPNLWGKSPCERNNKLN